MAKKAFAFALGERVNVPGKKGVQGVVSLPRATDAIEAPDVAGNPDLFFLRWLQDNGWPVCGWFGEPDLTAANRPASVCDQIDTGLKPDPEMARLDEMAAEKVSRLAQRFVDRNYGKRSKAKIARRTRKPRRKPSRKSKVKR